MNNEIVVSQGFNGHYPIPIGKDIAIVTIKFWHNYFEYTYKFQLLVNSEDETWQDEYVDPITNKPILNKIKDILNLLSIVEFTDEEIKNSRVDFEYLEEIPYIYFYTK